MSQDSTSNYGLSQIPRDERVAAPVLDYLPAASPDHRLPIGLIGAGGISEYHLRAYRAMGLEVVAICDVDRARAERRRLEFYPEAEVVVDYQQILSRDDIAVVDIATHPAERLEMVPAALRAGKHVLSQKPFVHDLDDGRRLVDLADRHGVKLAVNQNGRWAPHFSYIRQAVKQPWVGPISSIDFSLQWDHTWTVETPFNEIHHLILYDFGIHWFDLTANLMGNQLPESIYAAVRHTAYQRAKPPFLAHVAIDYPYAQVRMNFNAHTTLGQEDRTVVVGRDATLRAWGPSLNDQQVRLWTTAGQSSPELHGCWFENGFQGTMGELLAAIHEHREPVNSARDNLRGLQLCFAAIASVNRRQPVNPTDILRLDG